jgi:hypothetical protein
MISVWLHESYFRAYRTWLDEDPRAGSVLVASNLLTGVQKAHTEEQQHHPESVIV